MVEIDPEVVALRNQSKELGVERTGLTEWARMCCLWPVVRRALKYCLVVGAILIAINHGDAILRGDLTTGRLLKMGLTVVVPYFVSAFSSVGAMRELSRRQANLEVPPRD